MSLWDASSIEDVQQWIDANLMDGVAHISEVGLAGVLPKLSCLFFNTVVLIIYTGKHGKETRYRTFALCVAAPLELALALYRQVSVTNCPCGLGALHEATAGTST